MDGLRELARNCPEFPLEFEPQPETEFPAFWIESTPSSAPSESENETLQSHRGTLRQSELGRFFQDLPSKDRNNKKYPSRLICVGMGAPGRTTLKISSEAFREVLIGMDVDPWVEHLIRNQTYGFYHHVGRRVSLGNGSVQVPVQVASYVLKVRHFMAVWTCQTQTPTPTQTQTQIRREGEKETTGRVSAKCLIIDSGDSPASLLGSRINLELYLKTFQSAAPSSLYLPFVFSVNAVRWMENRLERIMNLVRRVETRTGHGTWGLGRFEEKRESIPNLTAALATELNVVTVLPMHLRTIEKVFNYLEEELARGCDLEIKRNKRLREAETSMAEAISLLKQECASVIQRCAVVEVRIRSQSSVLFAFLTHEDSKINIQVANASKALAEAARQDGSSMKTIAVLTMAFLPATFLAALFSVPSLGWDQPDKFVLYWACTIPITIFTFGLWAALTKREAVVGMANHVRRAFARG